MVEVFRKRRHPTDLPVELETPLGKVNGRLIDVNEMGARIAGEFALEKGQQVTLINRMDKLPGVVRWVGGDRFGMTFRPMLTTRQLDMLRGSITTAKKSVWHVGGLQELR